MDDSPETGRPSPALTPAAQAALRARREREAAALRENLRRRKQQTRGRATTGETAPKDDQDPSCP